MSDFPMPEDLSQRSFVPTKRPDAEVNLRALERDITKQVSNYSYNAQDPTQKIKAEIKLLTHRQMRQMCKEICNDKTEITAAELPDILDRFAHGD